MTPTITGKNIDHLDNKGISQLSTVLCMQVGAKSQFCTHKTCPWISESVKVCLHYIPVKAIHVPGPLCAVTIEDGLNPRKEDDRTMHHERARNLISNIFT